MCYRLRCGYRSENRYQLLFVDLFEPTRDLIDCSEIKAVLGITGQVRLIDPREESGLRPLGTCFGQVPPVIMAVKLLLFRLTIKPLIVAAPAPVVYSENT